MKTSNVFSVLLPSLLFSPHIFFPQTMLSGERICVGEKGIDIAIHQENISNCRAQTLTGFDLVKGRIDIKGKRMILSDSESENQQAVVGFISEDGDVKTLIGLDVGTFYLIDGDCALLCERLSVEEYQSIKDDKTVISLQDEENSTSRVFVLRIVSIGELALRQRGIERSCFEQTKLIAQ